jgi:hypothetical protein
MASRVRSPITSRSHWLTLASKFIIRRPVAVVASRLSCRLTKGHAFFLEQLHEAVEIFDAAGEAVQLVDDDRPHLPRLDQRYQAFQARAPETFRAHPFIPDDLRHRPILHQGVGVDLLRLHVQAHPVSGLLTGTHPRIPDDLHVDSLHVDSLVYDPR